MFQYNTRIITYKDMSYILFFLYDCNIIIVSYMIVWFVPINSANHIRKKIMVILNSLYA